MISASDLKKGLTIELDGQLYSILEYEPLEQARQSGNVRMKLRNLATGAITEHSFDEGHKFQRIDLDRRTVTYQYQEGDDIYHFMDTSTFEDIIATPQQLGNALNYLVNNLQLELDLFNDEVVSVELPESVVLKVASTEPVVKGEVASTTPDKPATTETGLVVKVPHFISEGDLIRVNTATGEYMDREEQA